MGRRRRGRGAQLGWGCRRRCRDRLWRYWLRLRRRPKSRVRGGRDRRPKRLPARLFGLGSGTCHLLCGRSVAVDVSPCFDSMEKNREGRLTIPPSRANANIILEFDVMEKSPQCQTQMMIRQKSTIAPSSPKTSMKIPSTGLPAVTRLMVLS